MIIHSPTHRTGCKPAAAWAGAAALALGFLFGSPAALAAAPPANTVIGNQASASYTDPGGMTQLATSNLVQTMVQQVGSFNLDGKTSDTNDVVNTKTGAAGNTVYAPHVLTNTGNGADGFDITVASTASGFSRVDVFADANGDGLPDSTTALCSAVPAAICTVPPQTVAGNNGVFQFVVAYSIPSMATTPTTPFAFGKVTATVAMASPVRSSYVSTTAADRDNVNLTTVAAFSATKAISTPAVAWSANAGVWPLATSTGQRSIAGCAATVAGATSPAAGCVYTTYTLNFSNTGGAVGKFAISDTLPSGFTYVAGSAVWSNAPGIALGDGAAGDPAGIDFLVTGSNKLTAVVTALNPNVTQSVSFVVLVNETAAIGTSTTTNTATYNASDAGAADSTAPGTLASNTNPAAYTVTASYGIVLGSNASAVVVTGATGNKDVVAGTANAAVNDVTTAAAVSPGGSVSFVQRVFNTGNATDTVNITTFGSSFPAGTTFQLFNAGGGVALLDTTGDGVPDTGPIPAGGYTDIVVRANVPAGATGPIPLTVNVLGKSAGDASKIDATQDKVTAWGPPAALIDLTNTALGTGIGNVGSGDLGAGPSPLPTTTVTAAAGSPALFTLFLKNNDTTNNSYNLAASQTAAFPGSLLAGWTVKYVASTVTTAADCALAPAIAQPVAVAAGAQQPVNACVTPPVTQTPIAAQPIYFRVTSTALATTGVIVSDAKLDAVTVTPATTYGATLTPNNNGQVAAGGSVVYAHTLNSTGTLACGAYTLSAAPSPADVALGWTSALYVDVNGDGQLDAGDTLYTGASLNLGVAGTQKLLVKIFAPGGAMAGAADVATVTATFTANCGAPSATDISTVITGQIRLLKTQALNAAVAGACPAVPGGLVFSAAPITTAKPGDCIVYRVLATNEGAAPVSNLAINDAIPAFTSLTGATQPAVPCTSSPGVTGAAVAYASTASAVSCGSAPNVVVPGGTATLTFSVKINN